MQIITVVEFVRVALVFAVVIAIAVAVIVAVVVVVAVGATGRGYGCCNNSGN